MHTQTHEKSTVPTEAVQELDVKCVDEISRAGSLAVMLDLRLKSFAEAHEGIELFVESTFKAGQTIPYGVSINRKPYSPMTAIYFSLEKMVLHLPISFVKYLKNHLMTSGGVVSIDSVTLKVQGRHFLGFTLRQMHIQKGKTVLERPTFSIISSTVLFVEGPDVGSGSKMCAIFDESSVYSMELISPPYRNDLPSSQTVKHQWHEWQTALSVVVQALETKNE